MITNERKLKSNLQEEITFNSRWNTLVVNEAVAATMEGLRYIPNFISKEEEREIIEKVIDANAWSQVLQRRQQFYGKVYYHTKTDNIHLQPGTEKSAIRDSLPLYPFSGLLEKCVAAGFFTNDESLHPDQVLVNEYTNSAGIRSHFEDTNAFGSVIVTISLNHPIWITLKKPLHQINSCPAIIEYTRILLQPQSCLIMAKDARYGHRHGITKAKHITTSINPTQTMTRDASYRRISLTIRKLGDGRKRVKESEDLNERGWIDFDPVQGNQCNCDD